MRPFTLSLILLLSAGLLWQCQGPGKKTSSSADVAKTGTLSLETIRQQLADPNAHQSFVPESLLGLPEDLSEFIPADNPMTAAKVELGRQLYFDKRLSRDGTVSCATCHDPAKGWTDNAPVSTGIDGQKGGRSAPTVVNRLLGKTQFWDGRAATLEEQALGPIANPIEMGFSVEEAVELLNEIEGYRLQFEAVFGGPATADGIAKAIAAFERTVLTGANKNDYYERAVPWFDWDPEDEEDEEWIEIGLRILEEEKQNRLSESALRGRTLYFEKAACSTCHFGADLTDEQFHNIGVGVEGDAADPGLAAISGLEEDWGKFKTPSLRNIALTAPYMHDGSQATLMDTIRHYNQGGVKNRNLSGNIFPLNLTEEEMQDLLAFLEEGLTGSIPDIQTPDLP
ncbi:MAG: cytochrome-c peroxidase [Planctomycetota bacterium]|nr:MAG: cytochrome-c peroxidase [Planctomycetota bacterium]